MNCVLFLGIWNFKFLILNLICLSTFFFLICSFIKSKYFRFLLSVFGSFFTLIQVSSFYFSRSFLNYSYLIHFNKRDIFGMLTLFKLQVFIVVFLFIVFVLVYYNADKLIKKVTAFLTVKSSFVKAFKATSIAFAVVIMSLKTGVLYEGTRLIYSLKTNDKSFEKQLTDLGINDYVKPNDLVVSSNKKNIVIISLESFEKGYLSDKFSKLTPFLRSLKQDKNWSYLDLNQNEGSKWTSGSLYTSITGFPAYFGTQHNSIFQSSYHSKITGITHILNKANYQLAYFCHNVDISGTEEMLYTLGVDKIVDQKILEGESQDKDIFEEVKKILLDQKESDKPFAYIISTLSTHFPNGIYDKRMEAFVSKQKSDLEFTVASTDYLLRDFISFLEEIKLLDNTIIYIYPDHLKMGNDAIFDGTGERGLFLLTNASKNKLKIKNNEKLYQLDIPKLLLNGSDIKHNGMFLTDYIKEDKNKFVEDHITQLTTLNLSGFLRFEQEPYLIPKKTTYYNEYKKDTLRYIAHAGGKINGEVYTNSIEALDLSYEKGFKIFELDIRRTKDSKFVAVHEWEEWAKKTGFTGSLPPSHKDFLKNRIKGELTPMDMDSINDWFSNHKDAILITDKIDKPKAFSEKFVDIKRLKMELFSLEAIEEALELGLNSIVPSQRVILGLGNKTIEILKKYNISEVAMSRNRLAEKIDLFKELKFNGIKVYVYNVNENVDIGEDYVVKFEMDYIYGMYADDWDF